jgi:quercetin dioxygenase-like cupin family protein
MARVTQEENEASVLRFRRDKVNENVHVATVALRRGESSLFHHHTRTRDTFYVMSGQLVVTLKHRDGPSPGYHAVTVHPPKTERTRTGWPVTRVVLLCGDVLVVEPGVVHCAANLSDEPCEFLCIEGVGEYDFVLEDGA